MPYTPHYRGQWNVSTNLPVLVDGTGSVGDFYTILSSTPTVTRNLGSGSKLFTAGFVVVYTIADEWIPVPMVLNATIDEMIGNSGGGGGGGFTNPMTTIGDMIYAYDNAGDPARLPIGSTGQVLTVEGGIPTWANTSGNTGTVTSIAPADSTLTLSPNPIISTGTIKINLANGNTWTAPITVMLNALGTTEVAGLLLENTTPATSGTPLQKSPCLDIVGTVWNGVNSVASGFRIHTLNAASGSDYIFEIDQLYNGAVVDNLSALAANAIWYANGYAIRGNTSGVVTIESSMGTWVFTLPTNPGTSGYALITDGAGNTSWQYVATSGITTATPPIYISGTNIYETQATSGTSGYLSSSDWLEFYLKMNNPMTSIGDMVYSYNNSGTPARLPIGSPGQILLVNAGIPDWTTMTGDININTSGITTIQPNAVTYSKIQTEIGLTLLGNSTSGTTNTQAVGLGPGLAFIGGLLTNTSGASSVGFVPYLNAIADVNINTHSLSGTTSSFVTANINYPTAFGGALNINGEILSIQNSVTPLSLANALFDSEAMVNNYIQHNIRNASGGANASGDYIVTADIGSDTSNYVDFGINNSGYSVAGWTVNGALDGYIYNQGGGMALGSASNNYVYLFTGGLLSTNRRIGMDGLGNIYFYPFGGPGGVFYGNISHQVLQTTSGNTNQVLIGGTNPTFSTLSATSGITGIVQPGNGGTGIANAANSTVTLSPYSYTLQTSGNANVVLPVSGILAALEVSQTWTAPQTEQSTIWTNNAITAILNTATIPISYRLNTVTNNSAATLTITMATAGAIDGQLTMVRIYDFSAAAQTITWVNTESSAISVPIITNGSTSSPVTAGFQFNGQTSKWRIIASS